MKTLNAPQVTDLVHAIVQQSRREGLTEYALHKRLATAQNTPKNWTNGARMDLKGPLLMRLSEWLQIPVTEVLSLHYGQPIEDKVADAAMIARADEIEEEAKVAEASPRPPNRPDGATHLAEVFTLRPDPAHPVEQPATLQAMAS